MATNRIPSNSVMGIKGGATYIAQSRRNADANWVHLASGYRTVMETAQSYALGDAMIKVGFRHSELDAHRYDLVTGLVLTAENGTQFRILTMDDTTLEPLAQTNANAERLADEMHEELRHGLLAQLINEHLRTLPEAAREEIGTAYARFGDALLGVKYRARESFYKEV